METHTLLGATGNIGMELARQLQAPSHYLRLVSRKPFKINPDDNLHPADLLNPKQVNEVMIGTDTAYLVAGLPYSTKTWKSQWPVVMKNVIQACINHKVKLVFFDNMYAYDPSMVGNLRECTPMAPKSEKGKVRARIAHAVMEAVEKGKLKAMILRSADFYGPNARHCFLNETVIKRIKAGKKPQWLYNKDKKHSFTYIPDAAKATAYLAQQPDAWDQVWHLPTDPSFHTGQEIVNFLSTELKRSNSMQVLSPFMVQALSLFIPLLREIKELRYQLEEDYCFHSDKIQEKYQITPTPITSGLKACL
jgi:nucleoside-diphosphate-sugar epimerase